MSERDATLILEPEARISNGFIYKDEHPQLQIPFTAQIRDRRLEGKSISVTQAIVSGLLPPSGDGARDTVVLRFDFEGFSVSIFAEVQIEKLGASDSSEICLRFCEPTASHLAPLRYIMNSHLAGDLVTVGRFLGYTGPTQIKQNAPAAKSGMMSGAGKGLRHLALLGLSAALIFMAATVIRERVVFSYEARPVTLNASGDTMRATAAGQVSFINENARFGEVAYSISANSGELLSVRMPCDCEVSLQPGFYEGATVLAGTPLLTLARPDAPVQATTQISLEGAARILAGDEAELVLRDGRIVPVAIDLMDQTDNTPSVDLVGAQITLVDPAMEETVIGETGRLRFRRDLLPDLSFGGT